MSVAEIAERKPRKPNDQLSLWTAFVAAQQEFRAIVKDAQGQRSKYAPLDTVLEMVRPILNAHGLALTQPTFVAGETLFVRTVLVCMSTGETHESCYPAGALTLQHQQLGASVTYARRYSLLSILGVFPAEEDDDGERAGAAGASSPPRKISNDEIAELQERIDATGTEIEAFCRYLCVGSLAELDAPAGYRRALAALEAKANKMGMRDGPAV